MHKTDRFHDVLRLFSNRLKKTSKRGKNINDTLGYRLGYNIFVLTIFDVICDLLLNRRTATRNLSLSVLHNKQIKKMIVINLADSIKVRLSNNPGQVSMVIA